MTDLIPTPPGEDPAEFPPVAPIPWKVEVKIARDSVKSLAEHGVLPKLTGRKQEFLVAYVARAHDLDGAPALGDVARRIGLPSGTARSWVSRDPDLARALAWIDLATYVDATPEDQEGLTRLRFDRRPKAWERAGPTPQVVPR